MNVADVIARTVKALPAELAEAMGTIHIQVAPRPSDFYLSMGMAPDLMGAFLRIDPEYGESVGGAWIFIFTDNIPQDESSVTLVLLHEIGHAIGMDEYEIRALGLGPEAVTCH